METSNSVLIVTNDDFFSKEADLQFGKFFLNQPSFKVSSFHEVLNYPSEKAPVLILIDLSEAEEFIFSTVKRICARFESSRIVCAGQLSDVSIVLEFVKMGVKDFLKYPFETEELEVLSKALMKQLSGHGASATNHSRKAGQIVTVCGPKGGAGVTLLSANMAVALAEKSPELKVVVCDFSPQCGDVATYLNLVPKFTFSDVIENHLFLDESFLEGVLVKHSSGVKVLAASTQSEEAPQKEHVEVIDSVFKLLQQEYDIILVDGGHLEQTLLKFVISNADMVFLAGNPDIVSLKGLINHFNRIKAMQFDPQKIKVVINRYNSKSHIDIKEFEKKTKHPIAVHLPNNYFTCIDAINTGQPLSYVNKKSDLSQKFQDIANIILNQSELSSGTNGNGHNAKNNGKRHFDFNKLPRWTKSPISAFMKNGD